MRLLSAGMCYEAIKMLRKHSTIVCIFLLFLVSIYLTLYTIPAYSLAERYARLHPDGEPYWSGFSCSFVLWPREPRRLWGWMPELPMSPIDGFIYEYLIATNAIIIPIVVLWVITALLLAKSLRRVSSQKRRGLIPMFLGLMIAMYLTAYTDAAHRTAQFAFFDDYDLPRWWGHTFFPWPKVPAYEQYMTGSWPMDPLNAFIYTYLISNNVLIVITTALWCLIAFLTFEWIEVLKLEEGDP